MHTVEQHCYINQLESWRDEHALLFTSGMYSHVIKRTVFHLTSFPKFLQVFTGSTLEISKFAMLFPIRKSRFPVSKNFENFFWNFSGLDGHSTLKFYMVVCGPKVHPTDLVGPHNSCSRVCGFIVSVYKTVLVVF